MAGHAWTVPIVPADKHILRLGRRADIRGRKKATTFIFLIKNDEITSFCLRSPRCATRCRRRHTYHCM